MKKIFAIALALVMVLSMASAFASACVTGPFNWSATATAANCGKGKVEVVPLLRSTTAAATMYGRRTTAPPLSIPRTFTLPSSSPLSPRLIRNGGMLLPCPLSIRV